MPKVAIKDSIKIQHIIRDYPAEFIATPNNELFCKLCETVVRHEKRFLVESHRQSARHGAKIVGASPSTLSTSSQQFISFPGSTLAASVARSFLAADIPLKKLQHPALKQLFTDMGKVCPSESSFCRQMVQILGEEELSRVKDLVKGKQIFLIIDETTILDKNYINILVGSVNTPSVTYLVDCKTCIGNINSQITCQAIDDVIRFLGVCREEFLLLLTDAAPYMIKAGKVLKTMFTNLMHITCLAHLLHNSVMHIRVRYSAVDLLIAKVKALVVKNTERRACFVAIGQPPQPVLTRWGTWLEAALYYADHLPEVKQIIGSFKGEGLLVKGAKEAVEQNGLNEQLIDISKYKPLVALLVDIQQSKWTIRQTLTSIEQLQFGDDPCGVKQYIAKRLAANNDLTVILGAQRQDISPTTYHLLQQCQATTCAVERSFSQLKHMLRKDRHFKSENLKYYAAYMFNHSVKCE